MAGLSDTEYYDETFGFWNNVYGFKMSSGKKRHKEEPFFDHLKSQAIVTS